MSWTCSGKKSSLISSDWIKRQYESKNSSFFGPETGKDFTWERPRQDNMNSNFHCGCGQGANWMGCFLETNGKITVFLGSPWQKRENHAFFLLTTGKPETTLFSEYPRVFAVFTFSQQYSHFLSCSYFWEYLQQYWLSRSSIHRKPDSQQYSQQDWQRWGYCADCTKLQWNGFFGSENGLWTAQICWELRK